MVIDDFRDTRFVMNRGRPFISTYKMASVVNSIRLIYKMYVERFTCIYFIISLCTEKCPTFYSVSCKTVLTLL